MSMGLGPLNAIDQAHVNRYLHAPATSSTPRKAGCGASSGTASSTNPRPAAARGGRPGAPGQPDLRGQLQPAAPRRPGPGQRQDHPGVEALFRGAGWNVIKVVWGRTGTTCCPGRRRCPAEQDEHHGRRRVPEVRRRGRCLHPGALLRPDPRLRGRWSNICRTTSSSLPRGRPRLPQALRRLQGGHRAQPGRRRSSWPRRSRAGRSAPRSRPATPPTRSRR